VNVTVIGLRLQRITVLISDIRGIYNITTEKNQYKSARRGRHERRKLDKSFFSAETQSLALLERTQLSPKWLGDGSLPVPQDF